MSKQISLTVHGQTKIIANYLEGYGLRLDPRLGWHGLFNPEDAEYKKLRLEELAKKRGIKIKCEVSK